MEPINYRDALRRRWPLVIALALVGALIAVLVPVHGSKVKTEYEAYAVVGVTPGSSKAGLAQFKFYAANTTVMATAAKAAGIKEKPANLVGDVVFPSAKKKKKKSASVPGGAIKIAIKQPSPKRSAKLTNAFVEALINFVNQQDVTAQKNQLRNEEQKVSNLTNEIQSLEEQITALEPTTTTTTTTTVPKATTTTTTTTTVPKSTTTTAAPADFGGNGGGATGVLVAAKSNPQVSQLQEQLTVLNNAYKAALTKVNSLKQSPPPQSGLLLLFPAHKATKTGSKSSILDRHSVRGLLGIVVGALLGVVLAFLLDALNKTLRTAARTQEMLGYQVLAEIPATNPSRSRLRRRRDLPPPPVFATFSEPGSAVAEAYRMLRTAVLLEPIVGPAVTTGPDRPSADPASPDADRDGAGPPAQTPGSPGAPDRRSRQVILVVSPGVEPTRALVVTNLAAAFAEAGESALIVTTADLRDRNRLEDTLVVAPVGGELTETTVAASTRPTEAPGVRSLALSSVIGGPGLLATRAPAVLAAAREISDAVIIDAPLLAVHDAEALVPAVDVVVVVIESWWTRVDQATTSGIFLRRIAAPVLGAVLTEIRLGKKDLRRVVEPPRRRTDAEDEERLVGTSPMGRLRRKRGRDARWLEA